MTLQETKEYWNSRFPSQDKMPTEFRPWVPGESLSQFLYTHVLPGGRVLDVGCGGGRIAAWLAQEGFSVTGCDISESAVAWCTERFRRQGLMGQFVAASFNALPFPDATFHAVVCSAVLDHGTLDQAQAALAEVRRVLRAGGGFYASFDSEDTDENRLHETEVLPDGTLRFVGGDQKGMLFRRYKDEEILDLVAGLNLISFTKSEAGTRFVYAFRCGVNRED